MREAIRPLVKKLESMGVKVESAQCKQGGGEKGKRLYSSAGGEENTNKRLRLEIRG